MEDLPRLVEILKEEGDRVLLAVTIDTECDKGPKWLIQRPLTFRAVSEGIPDRLEPLLAEYHAKATYLLSPEVMQNDHCVAVLKTVQNNGAELGTHLHGEFIEPHLDNGTDATWIMQNTYSRVVETEKLKNLTKLFTHRFGHPPRSFRAGRFGIGENSLPTLAKLGYTVDSSVASYCRWSDKGGEVSFFGAPVKPYHPHPEDPLRPGDLPILEVPITIGNSWWEHFPPCLLRSVSTFPRWWFFAIHQFGLTDRFKPTWLRPTWFSVEKMKSLIISRLRRHTHGPVVIVMMFHNVEVVKGCSPSAQTEDDTRGFLTRLRGILDFARTLSADFVGLADIRELLTGRENPSED